jgi:iron uptake system component EfeO
MRAVRPPRRAAAAIAVAAALAAVSGCAEKSDAKGSDAVRVTADDTACEVSDKEIPAGPLTLAVENRGAQITEVYLYGPGGRIVTERENIGPGTKVDITAEVRAGSYEIACKPGMKGDGIRQQVQVTDAGTPDRQDPRLDRAVAGYRSYAQAQADETIPKVEKFAAAIEKGDIEAAKQAYAPSRVGWERTEPVAESFGDIDPKVDLRADGVEQGVEWTGWHRLEKALWQDKKIGAAEKDLAARLVTDLKGWQTRVREAEITPTGMANGAKELLDEVATGKVTGEEERYSHTDLVDFQANVEGAQKSYELLKPVASENDPELAEDLDKRFAALFKLLGAYRVDGSATAFVSYDTVGKAGRKELSDGVNALAEPLSTLAAALRGGTR